MATTNVKAEATVRSKIVTLAQSQIGYKETGNNHTKYAQYFDTPKSKGGPYPWFNGKKQNTAWCAIFVNWLEVMVLEPKEYLGSPDAVRVWLGYPSPANNCAAGCPYMWGYLVKKGWQVSKSSGQPGDIIFFNTSSKCGHVGIIEKVDSGNYYTIEGNKSNMVKRCSYSKGSSSIYGIISPNYESLDPKPDPEPTPEPTPTTVAYKVKTNGGTLTLRAQPTTNSRALATIKNGTTIQVSEIVKGEAVNGNTDWAKTTYNGDTGYCSCRWLVKEETAPANPATSAPTPAPVKTYPKYVVTAVHGLNVRRGPGTGYTVIKTLKQGTTVTVYETKSGWGRIGTSQWCSMTYLKRK